MTESESYPGLYPGLSGLYAVEMATVKHMIGRVFGGFAGWQGDMGIGGTGGWGLELRPRRYLLHLM